MRKPIIAGNWKLNLTNKEACELANHLINSLNEVETVETVLCPVFTALSDVHQVIQYSHIQLGAQNCYWEDSGAFTGEVSAPLLKSVGVHFVILGHSERRQFFAETDETVNKRIRAVLDQGMTPIVCVGELLEERESDRTADVVTTQVKGALSGYTAEEVRQMVIAYEPVWAIGTGKTATPGQAQDVHKLIRDLLKDLYDDETADTVRLQYGGSVKPDNIAELIKQPDIDGALVGGASLKADAFTDLVSAAAEHVSVS